MADADNILETLWSRINERIKPGENAELKSYVDTQVGIVGARVDSRPAFFSAPGGPPASIPGAVVGDYYLNETTMELHKITGV